MKIFGKFEKGDIVVSTIKLANTRSIGDMVIIEHKSEPNRLQYTNWSGNYCESTDEKSWRIATHIEQNNYSSGIRNVNNIITEPNYEIY